VCNGEKNGTMCHFSSEGFTDFLIPLGCSHSVKECKFLWDSQFSYPFPLMSLRQSITNKSNNLRYDLITIFCVNGNVSLTSFIFRILRYFILFGCDDKKFVLSAATVKDTDNLILWLSHIGREDEAAGFQYTMEFKDPRRKNVIKFFDRHEHSSGVRISMIAFNI
jgi:hypothetical protein